MCMRKGQHGVFMCTLCHIRRSIEIFCGFRDDYNLIHTLFSSAVFTDSPSLSPAPHPPVWGPCPPPQSFAPQQMFPSPSPVGYNLCRVEQHPGVYVCEYMWGVWRGVCVCDVIRMVIWWPFKSTMPSAANKHCSNPACEGPLVQVLQSS